MSQQTPFEKTIELIDAANREDPNRESSGGESRPKELLYGERMSEMIGRFMPDADEVGRIAVRAQHIERWKSPRDAFPMNRDGYFQWRTQLYKFHADTVAGLMTEAGCDEASIERVRKAVGKKAVKINRDTQLLEDVAALVFIEHYMQAFATSIRSTVRRSGSTLSSKPGRRCRRVGSSSHSPAASSSLSLWFR